MAQNLSFSVDNILRSDFPHPSRITKAPRMMYIGPPLCGTKVPFVALRCQLDRRINHCSESEFFASGGYSGQTPEKDVYQSSDDIGEPPRKRGKLNIIFNIWLLVKFLSQFIHFLTLLQSQNLSAVQLKNVVFLITNHTWNFQLRRCWKCSLKTTF